MWEICQGYKKCCNKLIWLLFRESECQYVRDVEQRCLDAHSDLQAIKRFRDEKNAIKETGRKQSTLIYVFSFYVSSHVGGKKSTVFSKIWWCIEQQWLNNY